MSGDDTGSTSTVTVEVRDGWAVHDGTAQRTAGQRVDVDPDVAARWVTAGWVEPVEPKVPRRRRRG